MTFEEKSAWAMLFIMVGVYGLYFINVIPPAIQNPVPIEDVAAQLIGMVVLLIILAIVAHIAITIFSPKDSDQADERDRYIEMRADARSSYFIAVGVLNALGAALLNQPMFWVAHILLASLVIGEIAKSIFRIIDYRFGV